MLKLRILSALIGIPVLLVASWLGGLPLFFLVVALMVGALYEMHKVLLKMNVRSTVITFPIGALIVAGGVYYLGNFLWPVVLVLLLTLHFLLMLFSGFKYTFRDGLFSLLAFLYVSLFIYIYLVGILPGGWQWMLLLLLTTWANDTFAYFTGTKLGRHKLAPVISPNKTIEGALGGLLGSILVSICWGLYFGFLGIFALIVLGFLLALAGQIGDLLESAIKRRAGIKDSGNIIPGHGGILDRFDSMLLSAPLLYYYLSVFIIS